MAITNFYLPTGLTVSGSTSLTGSLHVTQNVVAESFTGSFSGSDAQITNISASVISANAIHLPEPLLFEASTIRANEILALEQIKTNFISASSVSTDNLLLPDPLLLEVSTVRTNDLLALESISTPFIFSNQITASNLYISDPFVFISEVLQSNDLEIIGTANINKLNLETDKNYNIINNSIEENFIDVEQAINILDNSIFNDLSKKIKITGTLDNFGFVKLNLTSLNYLFNTASLDYITLNTSIKDNNRWAYHGFSVEMYNSGSNVYVEITAGANNVYKLIAINEE